MYSKSIFILLFFGFFGSINGFAETVFFHGILPGTPHVETQIAQILGKDNGRIVFKQSAGRSWKFWKRPNLRYLIEAKSEKAEQELSQLGLQKTQAFYLDLRMKRISDINGWGTSANGEVHRSRVMNMSIRLESGHLGTLIKLAEHLVQLPFAVAEAIDPESFASVFDFKPLVISERGFVGVIGADFSVEDALSGQSKQLIYKLNTSSDYLGSHNQIGHYSWQEQLKVEPRSICAILLPRR